MSKYLWLLDPGHGGVIDGEYQTPGKRSPLLEDNKQLYEGEFNRAIVQRILKRYRRWKLSTCFKSITLRLLAE